MAKHKRTTQKLVSLRDIDNVNTNDVQFENADHGYEITLQIELEPWYQNTTIIVDCPSLY